MVRGLKLSMMVASGAMLLSSAAWACDSHAEEARQQNLPAPSASEPARGDADAAPTPSGTRAAPAHCNGTHKVAATCSCGGASDCTCKKGKCACKNCRQHHLQETRTELTPLFERLGGAVQSPELPKQARQEARAGYSI